MTKQRMSKKMIEKMDRIIENVESIGDSEIRFIPDFVDKTIKDFREMSKIAISRGWDFGLANYRKVQIIESKIKHK